MKQNIIKAGLLTFGLLLVLMVIYPFAMWCVAQVAPNRGKGFVVENNKQQYYQNIGQQFTRNDYFWGRPSAVTYNAAGSGASNKGSNNEAYLKEVEQRLHDFLKQNPTVKREEVPVDLLTASGSGLDPDISVQAALVQVNRIAGARKINKEKLLTLVYNITEKPLLGLFGPEKINVVKLNIALDNLSK